MLPPQLLRVLRELLGPNVEVGAAAVAVVLERVVYRYLPLDIEVENDSEPNEYAATVELDPKPLALTLDQVREVEVPLLNGY